VPFETDWFECEVLDLINQALESSGRKERLIALPSVDQLVFIVFVPPDIYEQAVAEKLIPRKKTGVGLT
jgi:hypothetical protein